MRLLSILILGTIVFFAFTELCYANPIAVNPSYEVTMNAFLVLFFIAPPIEAGIVIFIAKQKTQHGKHLQKLFWLVVLINIVTFIGTQVLAYFIARWAGIYIIGYVAEILPLVAEYLLLRRLLTKLHLSGTFTEPFSNKKVMGIVILANLITLAAGIVLLVAGSMAPWTTL